MTYADGTVLTTSNLCDTQYILGKLDKRYNEYRLKFNFKETNPIVVAETPLNQNQIN